MFHCCGFVILCILHMACIDMNVVGEYEWYIFDDWGIASCEAR